MRTPGYTGERTKGSKSKTFEIKVMPFKKFLILQMRSSDANVGAAVMGKVGGNGKVFFPALYSYYLSLT